MALRTRPTPLRIRELIAHIAILGLILTLLVGVSPAAAAGTLSGTVTGDGSPLSDVTVELTAPGGSTVLLSTTTTGSGGYVLTPEAGTYDLTARPPAGSPYGPSTVSGIEVAEGGTPSVDLVLVTVGGIPAMYGTLSVGGVGVEGATVRLAESGGPVVQTLTDADGSWVAVPPVRSGRFGVTGVGACASPSVPEQWGISSFYDVDIQTTQDYAPRFVELAVDVLTAGGDPIEGAVVESLASARQDTRFFTEVSAANRGRTGCPEILTDATGTAVLTTVPSGTTTLLITPPGYPTFVQEEVQVGFGDTSATVQLPPPPVTVSGTILGFDGVAASNMTLNFEVGGELRARTTTDAAGFFSLPVTPGSYDLEVFGRAASVGRGFFSQFTVDVPAGADLALGTWQVPLAAVDLRISLADTGEEIRPPLLVLNPEPTLATQWGDASGTVRIGGSVFPNTSTEYTGDSIILADSTYALTPRNPDDVPNGYDWPENGWQVTSGPIGTSSTATLALEPTTTPMATVTGLITQDGQPVQGAGVSIIGGDATTTSSDGTFSLQSTVGTVDIGISTGKSDAGSPNFASGRLRDVNVPDAGLDLGELNLPWIPLNVSVSTPTGEPPVFVNMDTNLINETIDSGWGLISWTGGYLADQYTQLLLADGSPTTLWFTPSRKTVNFTFTPIDQNSPYQAVDRAQVVDQGGNTLAIQLVRPVPPGPVASVVSPVTVTAGESVVLDASGSTGTSLTYGWTASGGTLDSDVVAMPEYTAGATAGVFSATVTVTDDLGRTDVATVQITVEAPVPPGPVASVVSPVTVTAGESVVLDASGSTGTSLTYGWTASGGTLDSDVVAMPEYTAGATAGVFSATVTVTDDLGRTDVATVQITVEAPVPPGPVASVVSPVTVTAGESVVLDASGSTGTSLTYGWTASGGTLDSDVVAMPEYTAGATAGVFSATVTVTDDLGRTDVATVQITVEAPVPPGPVASVVSPVTVTAGESVVLDASGSTGTSLTYGWTASGGTLDSDVVAMPEYTAGATAGVFSATVTVTDDLGRTDVATVQITVEAAEPPQPTSDGFVTGGGWIGNGPGAGTGGTNFGFQVRSRDGVLSGSFTAQIHASGLRLFAERFDTFIVTDSTVTFSGTARVDGLTGYRFTVVVTDGGKGRAMDTFALTVTAPDGSIVAVATDQVLVSGQVVVHGARPQKLAR